VSITREDLGEGVAGKSGADAGSETDVGVRGAEPDAARPLSVGFRIPIACTYDKSLQNLIVHWTLTYCLGGGCGGKLQHALLFTLYDY
jgi:hypothetical protein